MRYFNMLIFECFLRRCADEGVAQDGIVTKFFALWEILGVSL
jgi:hypothetical protein